MRASVDGYQISITISAETVCFWRARLGQGIHQPAPRRHEAVARCAANAPSRGRRLCNTAAVATSGMTTPEPPGVRLARERAKSSGFALSSDNGVGALLASLAAAVRPHGTIVELGTGAGVGLAWIVHGIGARTDVTVHTVDIDPTLLAATSAVGWPRFVHFVEGDGARRVSELAPVDLVFADAAGGKIDGLERTIDALRPGGILIVDDMDPSLHENDDLFDPINRVRRALIEHPDLVTAQLDFSTGVVIATKREPV